MKVRLLQKLDGFVRAGGVENAKTAIFEVIEAGAPAAAKGRLLRYHGLWRQFRWWRRLQVYAVVSLTDKAGSNARGRGNP